MRSDDDARALAASAAVEAAAEDRWEALCEAAEADEDVWMWQREGGAKPTLRTSTPHAEAYNARLRELMGEVLHGAR